MLIYQISNKYGTINENYRKNLSSNIGNINKSKYNSN